VVDRGEKQLSEEELALLNVLLSAEKSGVSNRKLPEIMDDVKRRVTVQT